MTSNRPTPSLSSGLGSSASGDGSPPSLPEAASSEPDASSDLVVDELTHRLPTSELVKIIQGALERGRRNLPFTENDLVRAMTFGASSTYVRAPRDSGQHRVSFTSHRDRE